MKVLVTGATGFIGSHVAELLVDDGFEVRALVRKGSDLRNLEGLEVEIAWGDLLDPDSLFNALKGCTQLYHVAADYRLWTLEPKRMYDVNIGGTKAIIEAAKRQGVDTIVYTSTVGALGNPGNGAPGNEETPVTYKDMVGHYKKSKYLAEIEALHLAKEGLPLVIVNPSTPVGPRDRKPTPTGKIIVDFLNQKVPAYIETGLNLVDVKDVAMGHLLAARKGRAGEKYILGCMNLPLSEIYKILARITGLSAPKIELPYLPILGAAYISEGLSRWITKKEPLIPLAGVQMARKFMYFDASKAIKELQLPQSSVEKALEKAVEWFEKEGYVRKTRR